MNRQRSRISLVGLILAIITILIAAVTLLGIAPLGPIDFSGASNTLVRIAGIVGAIAVIIGVLNLLGVHVGKLLSANSASALYSVVTVITFIVVLAIHLLETRGVIKVSGENSPTVSLTLMDALQVVIESALSGLLFFFLVYSAYRLLRRRVSLWNALFVASLLIVLLGYVMPPGSPVAGLSEWLLRVPVSAGTRGLLIGIAIGTIAVGVRVLLGQNRLFRE
jgi:hypothetical protein